MWVAMVNILPHHSKLFWSRSGRAAAIESSFLDGSGRITLVSSKISWPSSIVADTPNGRLYWADPKQKVIESIAFDGDDRRIVHKLKGGLFPAFLFSLS
jgi:hypothetical protein